MDDSARTRSDGDIDLNVDPDVLNAGLGDAMRGLSYINDIETRIGVLEEIVSNVRETRGRTLTNYRALERSDVSTGFGGNETEVHNVESGVQRGRDCKSPLELIASALEDELDVKKNDSDSGSFYDCNICLEMAKDPVVTCCGHLFCWACFYRIEYVDLTAKECPVCRGDVIDSNVTPIYGGANSNHVSDSGSGVRIPPRPRAHRIESTRQRVNRWVTNVPVADALRRIRMGIAAHAEQLRQLEHNNAAAERARRQSSNTTAFTDLRPLWMTADIGSSRQNNAIAEQPGLQAVNTNAVTDSLPLWLTSEIGSSRPNNATAEQPGLQDLENSFADFISELEDWSADDEIGASQHEEATIEQSRQQNVNLEFARLVTDLQPLWMAADLEDHQHDSATAVQVRAEQPNLQTLDIAPVTSMTILEPLWLNGEIQSMRSRHLSRLLEARDLLSNSVAVIQTELQSINSTAETTVVPDAFAAAPVIAPLENPQTAPSVPEHPSLSHVYPFRRSSSSMVPYTEDEAPRESQRRRLR